MADSIGARNTSTWGCVMGRSAGWMAARTRRSAMRSPGRPPAWRREHLQRFWQAIGRGMTSEAAGVQAGVSAAVGTRLFREHGGMPPHGFAALSGRYLSFPEREEIAILRAEHAGVREIARRLARSPSTISRELRRNAATRGGRLEYRATNAQWHADRRALRPKISKLAADDRLRSYVQDRARRRRQAPGRRTGEGSRRRLDRSSARPAEGPPLGDVVESGADRAPA